jgi:hypothetical protein
MVYLSRPLGSQNRPVGLICEEVQKFQGVLNRLKFSVAGSTEVRVN